MNKVKFWFSNARPVSLPQSMMPALVAAFLATKYSDFKWYLALISMIGVAFAHLSLNLFDDLFDYRNAQQGDRSALAREGFRAQTVKCPYLQDGTVTPKQWLFVSCLFGLIACCFGVPVLILRGIRIFYIVLGVAILGIFYSAPPLKLGYHGLGEIIIGLIFGPALGIGMSIAASGEFHASEVMVSCAIGLLVINILFVHSIMDYAADQKAGKKTLAFLVSSHKKDEKDGLVNTSPGPYITLALVNFIPFILIVAAFFLHWISAYFIVVLLALPWSVALFSSMLQFRKDPFGRIEKKWWYGRFAHWEEIKGAGIDWFMLRWYLAQKINTVFSILCILASIADMITKMMQL